MYNFSPVDLMATPTSTSTATVTVNVATLSNALAVALQHASAPLASAPNTHVSLQQGQASSSTPGAYGTSSQWPFTATDTCTQNKM